MSSKILPKPTTLQMLTGGIITLFRDSFHLSRPTLPEKIGKYVLIKDIQKERGYSYSFSLGIYELERKKYFIKHWEEKVKDLNYYNLRNEYLLGNFMAEKLAETKQITIRAPKIIEHLETPHSFSIVYEYIEGKSLSLYPEPIKSRILFDAIDVLENISNSLTREERMLFSKRSRLLYILSFFPLSIFVYFTNIRYSKIIIKSFWKNVRYILFLKKIPYGISHRDLDATNIVVGKDHAYLTDFETMTWTLSSYDVIRLTVMPDIKNFPEEVLEILKKPEQKFLRTYILFHLILSANAIPEVKNEYIKKLATYE